MTFDRTSRTPRGRVYQALVSRYRRSRAKLREDVPGVWEDPAPDWVWQLVEAILQHTAHEPDSGLRCAEEALAWCEAGNSAARSAELRAVLGAPIGLPPLARLRGFLDRAWKTPHVA